MSFKSTAGSGARTAPGKRAATPRLILSRRPETGVGEWLAAMVRGLDALEFLERSRELAEESVVASAPASVGARASVRAIGKTRSGIDEPRLDTHHRARENLADSSPGSAVR